MQINRRKSKKIKLGKVEIGGDAPISIQSMTNTKTTNIKATINQINELEKYSCEIVRVAVGDNNDIKALSEIKKWVNLPLVADIQFDHRLAIRAIEENAVDGIRLNPGNIKNKVGVKEVATIAKQQNIPIRIGVNSGSLSSDIIRKYNDICADALIEQALNEVKLLEEVGFDLIEISLKATDVATTIEAYRKIADKTIYPLHLGVTEAGPKFSGSIKSTIVIAILLQEGIGDTIRVSLTAHPVEEVKVATEILKGLGLRKGLNLISCPTCSRCEVDLIKIVNKFEKEFRIWNPKFGISIAIMGCVVNGPTEAAHADIGIAYGKKYGVLLKGGKIIKKVKNEKLYDELIRMLRYDKL